MERPVKMVFDSQNHPTFAGSLTIPIMISRRFYLVISLILAAAAVRLLPHAPNFAPVGAMGLFGAAYFRKSWALVLPFASLFLSDLVLNNTIYSAYFPTFTWISSPWMYLSFAAVVLVGLGWFSTGVSKWKVVGGAFSSSVVFFLVSNFGVFMESGLYPKTVAGLGMCYTAGLPFFTNTVASDLLYSTILFGVYQFAARKMAVVTVR
jgi:hypothetical protein